MQTYSTCDICKQPLDLCECHECSYCGAKISIERDFCSDECERAYEDIRKDEIEASYKY